MRLLLALLFTPFFIFSQTLNKNLKIGEYSDLSINSIKEILDKSDDPKEGLFAYCGEGEDCSTQGVAILKINETDYISINVSDNYKNFVYIDPSTCESINYVNKIGLVDGYMRPSNSIRNLDGNTYNATYLGIFLNNNNEIRYHNYSYTFDSDFKNATAKSVDDYSDLANYENCDIEEFKELLSNRVVKLKKLYPLNNNKPVSVNKPDNTEPETKESKISDWKGNGSGLIISKLGHIITNYHVIEDASVIEIEYKNDNGINKYNAEVSVVDESNDLAIIKIVDDKFNDLKETPNYNLDTDVKEIGNKVYTYGYPLALSIMGKEIKITDGIISSKTGINGDIKTYQITNPIQPGNSGGPMFDEDGNFIGVISSGLKKELADNVSYSIKSNYVVNLISSIPEKIEKPYSYTINWLSTEKQISRISEYVVLVKVK